LASARMRGLSPADEPRRARRARPRAPACPPPERPDASA